MKPQTVPITDLKAGDRVYDHLTQHWSLVQSVTWDADLQRFVVLFGLNPNRATGKGVHTYQKDQFVARNGGRE